MRLPRAAPAGPASAPATHVEIICPHPGLAGYVATEISLDSRFTVSHTKAAVEASELRVPADLPAADIAALRAKVRPFEVATYRRGDMPPGRVELYLGGAGEYARCKVKVFGATDLAQELAREFRALGFKNVFLAGESGGGDKILFGGAGFFAVAVADMVLRRRGCRPTLVKEWGDSDLDIYVQASPPPALDRTGRSKVTVKLVTDAPAAAPGMIEAVTGLGFKDVELECTDTSRPKPRIGLSAGVLEAGGDECGIAGLMAVAERFAAEAGVDPRGFPVMRLPGGGAAAAPVLHLPLRAISSGRAAPYAGSLPARYCLRVCTDDRPVGLELTSAFRRAGFQAAAKRHDHELSEGFAIRASAVRDDPRICEMVREVLEREMLARGILDCPISFIPGEEADTIEVLAPFAAHRDGTLAAEINSPKRFTLVVRGEERLAREIGAAMRALGFDTIEVEATEVEAARAGFVEYGGAPTEIIGRVREAIGEGWGDPLRLRGRKAWSVSDLRIVVNLPTGSFRVVRRQGPSATSGMLPFAGLGAPLFIEAKDDRLRIGELTLPRRPGPPHRLVPPRARFDLVCVDVQMATLLDFLARALLTRSPGHLIGETGASKSLSVSYLASWLNQPVSRLNFSGQTDTGDLIGRFVPAADGWRWHSGALPNAMREGIVLLMDEVNLGEPQVLERGNSAFERPPSLVVSEYDGEVIDAAHEHYAVVATSNPSGGAYSGRNRMSPAFENRFQPYLAPSPGEAENLAYLRQAVTGVGPDIEILGRAYRGARTAPVFPALADCLDDIFAPLASFHAAVAAAASREQENGSPLGGADAPTFTRRQLERFLDCMDRFGGGERGGRRAAASAALDFVYLRGASEASRAVIVDLAQAAGLPSGGRR